ncbi:zinc ribbon domain-containing protein [Micromonospora sp. DR5-3]|uniref:Zn-ribbon domain-containing OB-fold protein n=1 Tax=unclassified Micromonospora TaxID=2617518 RepID=UPI0011D7C7F7|nr:MULTISPECIES: zinc ribbon domain-containing protein [unclassified Micromonospora]MCW3817939.1 zinc ribbon domain-containing protein [Micromonospora sp. DR5-3]TYC21395.1 DNA-binding protein [Micromonospora sp. MP36]
MDSPHHRYLSGLQQRELRYQRCSACARTQFYPRTLCRHCGSAELDWLTSSGDGVVYSVTWLYAKDTPPSNIALIDVAEGFRMMSTVTGVPTDVPLIGRAVRAAIADDAVVRFELVAP